MTKISKNSGFTLVELIIAVAIFLVLILITGTVTISAIKFQRVALNGQNLQDNLRSGLELMGREIRLAAKDDTGVCLGAGNARRNYIYTPTTLQFLDDRGACLQFSLDNTGHIQQKVNFGQGAERAELLTSDSVEVTSLQFDVLGENGKDDTQPAVVIRLSARARNTTDAPLKLQTTLTQRELDVQ